MIAGRVTVTLLRLSHSSVVGHVFFSMFVGQKGQAQRCPAAYPIEDIPKGTKALKLVVIMPGAIVLVSPLTSPSHSSAAFEGIKALPVDERLLVIGFRLTCIGRGTRHSICQQSC